MRHARSVSIVLAMVVLPLLLLSCGKGTAPESAPAQPPAAPATPASPAAPAPTAQPAPSLPAEVIFANGDVQGQIQGTWSALEIGQKLNRGDAVKAGPASECQLKLSDLATVSIGENTQVSIDTLALGDTDSRAKLGLKTGTLLSKVKKLTGAESFVVRTETAVGGVRGTEFGVTVTPQGGTLVTVKEGTVAVLPAAFDPDEVRSLSAAPNPDLEQIAQAIESSASAVKAGQEVSVTPQQAKKADTDFQAIRVAAIQIVQEQQTVAAAAPQSGTTASPPPAPAAAAAREKTIQAATATLATLVSAPKALTPAHTQTLKAIDKLPEPAAPAPAGTSSSVPPTAPTAPATVVPVRVAVSTTPADSEIEMNGKVVGTGSYSADVAPGSSLTFVVRHEGYAAKTLALTAKGPGSYPVVLEPTPIEASFAASSAPLVGTVQVAGEVIVAVDRQGQLVGTDRQGKVRWKVATQNGPNENAAPVLSGGNLYFTGSKEFVIASARTGAVISRSPLDSATTHLFGQRVAVSGDLGVYPTSTSLNVFNTATGAAIRQIPITGGTLMTPTIADGRVLVVSQTGVFTAVDASSGQVLFQVPTGANQPVATSVLVSGNRAFFGDRKGLIVAVDMDARTVAWKATLKGSGSMGVFQDMEKSADGSAVFVFAAGTLFAFSAANGSELFAPVMGVATPPRDLDGKLYFGTQAGALAAVDDRSGKALQSLDMRSTPSTRPEADGPRLVVGTGTGRVLVVYPGSIQ